MGSQQDSAFYDKLWSQDYFNETTETLRWYPIWRSVSDAVLRRLVINKSPVRIIDLGCGPGHFVEVLDKTTKLPFSYVGYDFSPVAISDANKKNLGDRFTFKEADLFDYDFNESAQESEDVIYVSTEFFEHVEFDREVMKKIKSGCSLLFSVPNFDDPGHVRFFTGGEMEIRERYEDILDISSVQTMPDGYRFFIESVRK